MSETKVDPTAVGLLFIGFVLFVVGIFGLQAGEVIKDSWISGSDLLLMSYIVGIILVLVSYYAYKAGSLFGVGVFLWVAASFIMLCKMNIDDSWFMYVIIAIFFAIFTAWSFLAGSPKILVGVLACATLVFLFLGLGINASDGKIFFILMGVFSLIGFLLSTYLGFALTGVKELKVV